MGGFCSRTNDAVGSSSGGESDSERGAEATERTTRVLADGRAVTPRLFDLCLDEVCNLLARDIHSQLLFEMVSESRSNTADRPRGERRRSSLDRVRAMVRQRRQMQRRRQRLSSEREEEEKKKKRRRDRAFSWNEKLSRPALVRSQSAVAMVMGSALETGGNTVQLTSLERGGDSSSSGSSSSDEIKVTRDYHAVDDNEDDEVEEFDDDDDNDGVDEEKQERRHLITGVPPSPLHGRRRRRRRRQRHAHSLTADDDGGDGGGGGGGAVAVNRLTGDDRRDEQPIEEEDDDDDDDDDDLHHDEERQQEQGQQRPRRRRQRRQLRKLSRRMRTQSMHVGMDLTSQSLSPFNPDVAHNGRRPSTVADMLRRFKMPDALIEKVLHRMIERKLLKWRNIGAFAQCCLRRLNLANYEDVTDDWIIVLLRAQQPRVQFSKSSITIVNGDNKYNKKKKNNNNNDNNSNNHNNNDSSTNGAVTFVSTRVAKTLVDDSASPASMLLSSAVANVDGTLTRDGRSMSLSSHQYHALMSLDLSECSEITDAALMTLLHCDRLRVLRLRGCARVTDVGLHVLRRKSDLEVLDLERCSQITDRSLRHLADKHKLRVLILRSCSQLTDAGLAYLQHLTSLEVFDIGWCLQLTVRNLHFLPQNLAMRELNVSFTKIGTRRFENIVGKMLSLRKLHMAGSRVLDSALRSLRQLKRLEVLDLSRGRCRDIGYLVPTLRSLDISFTPISHRRFPAVLSHEALPVITMLNVESCSVDNEALKAIGTLVSLVDLNIADTRVTTAGMRHLESLVELKRLNFSCCHISNAGLRVLERLERLEMLWMDCADITDDGLVHLANLHELQHLDLFSCDLTDNGLAALVDLPKLHTLELCGGNISNAGLVWLGRMRHLESLNVSQNHNITDKGLSALAGLKHLRHLNLSRTQVTHRGLDFVRALPRMHSLSLFGCKVKPASTKLKQLPSHVHVGFGT